MVKLRGQVSTFTLTAPLTKVSGLLINNMAMVLSSGMIIPSTRENTLMDRRMEMENSLGMITANMRAPSSII